MLEKGGQIMQTWVISCSLKEYDVIGAFREFDAIDWKQSANFEVRDIIFIYVSHPIMKLFFKCVVEEIGLETRSQKDREFVSGINSFEDKGRYMRLKRITTFEEPIPFKLLSENGLKGNVQGPRRISGMLLEFIESYLEKSRVNNVSILEDNRLNESIQKSLTRNINPVKYVPKPKVKPQHNYVDGVKVYPRCREVAINALIRADFKCECAVDHSTFKSKFNGLPYMEAHHLIPLAYQDEFDFSLDVEANVVSLCSHCHNEFHYGQEANSNLLRLLKMRQNELMDCGIIIEVSLILEFYK